MTTTVTTDRSLLPRPRSQRWEEGTLTLRGAATVAADWPAVPAVMWLTRQLWGGARLRLIDGHEDTATITLRERADLQPEEYRLRIGTSHVRIEAADPAGFSHAVHTLVQLDTAAGWRRASARARDVTLPLGSVSDRPRFGWRGLMLDVARHFLPTREVLRFLDLMALHKLNVLHLHLTDDQGWRLEVLRYPRLTEVASWRSGTQIGGDDAHGPEDGRPHGGYYTQDDLREIVAYAADLGITVVPEIDLPGHSQAAIAAYPELGVAEPDGSLPSVEVWHRFGVSPRILNTEVATLDFYRHVLDELIAIFPSTYIGLGGDECDTTAWQRDARTQELMRERGLANEHELQSWFMTQLEQHLQAHGRRMIGWDEILEGPVTPQTAVLSWRGTAGGQLALELGLPVVMCPDDPLYLDYRQSDRPDEPVPIGIPIGVRDIYAFDPVPPGAGAANPLVLGAQANIWTEHIDSPRALDYRVWPRACALAEVLWSGPGGDVDEFEARLSEHLDRLSAQSVEFRDPRGPWPWQQRPGVAGRTQERDERDRTIDELTASLAARVSAGESDAVAQSALQ